MKFYKGKINISAPNESKLSLPLLKLDSEKPGPKRLLVANQHGSETAGIMLIYKLFEKIKASLDFNGSLFAVTTANPLGLIRGTRNVPVGDKNLNRQYPGNLIGDLSAQTAAKIFDLALGMDLVIDLHNFSRQSMIIGVAIDYANQAANISKEVINEFLPDAVWQITAKGADPEFDGCLDTNLIINNIPAFGLEMPPLEFLSDREIERIIESLYRAINCQFLLNQPKDQIVKLICPAYETKKFYSNQAGIFLPEKTLFAEVIKGEKIGTIIDVNDLSKKPVNSPESGILFTVKYKCFVQLEAKLGSIGRKVN